jgi:hypothetical protein
MEFKSIQGVRNSAMKCLEFITLHQSRLIGCATVHGDSSKTKAKSACDIVLDCCENSDGGEIADDGREFCECIGLSGG